MVKFTKKTFYIILFATLYSVVAFSSFWHAVEFFELSNTSWMGIILALAFEIGQATVLLSILTSKKDRGKFTPWLLMCILTLVQIIGNVYSSYKYILQNSPQNLRFFKEPIFIWTDLPDDVTTVIVTYVSSAILPLTALLLTSMLTNYLEDDEEDNKESQSDVIATEKVLSTDIPEETPILGAQSVEQGPQLIPQELTEEEMITKLKEMNPELHIGILDGPEEGEGRSNQQEIEDLNTLLNEADDTINDQKSTIEHLNEELEHKEVEKAQLVDEHAQAIYNLNKELESKIDELKSANSYVEDLDRTISVKDSALEEMNKIVKEKNDEIENLRAELQRKARKVEPTATPEPIVEEKIVEEEIKKEKPKRTSHFINLTR